MFLRFEEASGNVEKKMIKKFFAFGHLKKRSSDEFSISRNCTKDDANSGKKKPANLSRKINQGASIYTVLWFIIAIRKILWHASNTRKVAISAVTFWLSTESFKKCLGK
jgi:hypothetical protein